MLNSSHVIPVHTLADYVWPVFTCIDHFGNIHRLRKYLLMGKQGVTDENAIYEILPAKTDYHSISIDVYFEAIIVKSVIDTHITWLAFTFSGEPLFLDKQFETIEEIHHKLKERKQNF